MKKLRLLGLFFGLALVGSNVVWSQTCDTVGDGLQCDPQCSSFDPPACLGGGGPGVVYDDDVYNSDIDCGAVDNPACSIPIDGGLSLLALAGGGLATAAMRRRREEEEAAAQGAA